MYALPPRVSTASHASFFPFYVYAVVVCNERSNKPWLVIGWAQSCPLFCYPIRRGQRKMKSTSLTRMQITLQIHLYLHFLFITWKGVQFGEITLILVVFSLDFVWNAILYGWHIPTGTGTSRVNSTYWRWVLHTLWTEETWKNRTFSHDTSTANHVKEKV